MFTSYFFFLSRIRNMASSGEFSDPEASVGSSFSIMRPCDNHEEDEDDAEETEQQYRDAALVSMLKADIRAEMKSLFRQSMATNQSAIDPEEWDRIKLDHRISTIMNGASFLKSEGNKLQFKAFAKIKANLEHAQEKSKAGDIEGAIAAIERGQKVADIRLELIERADQRPGGWGAATVFEQLAETGVPSKYDKLWKYACSEAETTKTASSQDKTYRQDHHFRSV